MERQRGKRGRKIDWLIAVLSISVWGATGQEILPDQQSHLVPFSTSRLVRNLTVAVAEPLELVVNWNEAADTEGLSYYVLNVLHVTAEGTEEEYENILNATLTKINLKDEWKDERGKALTLKAGMRLAFRMRAVYTRGPTKILAGRVRAAPAYIIVLDRAGPSQMLRPCSWVNDTGACKRFSYACASSPAAAAPAANETGNCSALDGYVPFCTYVQPFSASFSWSAPIDVVSGAEYDVLKYHLQLYDQDRGSHANSTLREVTISPSSSITAVRFTNLDAWEGRQVALRVLAETRFENEAGSVNGSWSNMSSAILVPGLLSPPSVSAVSSQGARGTGYLNVDASIPANMSNLVYLPLLRFRVQISTDPNFEDSCVQQLGVPIQPFEIGNTTLSTRFHSLVVGRTHFIRATAISYTGPSTFSHPVAKTVVTPPSTPIDLAFRCVAALAFNVTWLEPDNIGCGVASTCALQPSERESALTYHLALLPIAAGTNSPPQLDEISDFAVATRQTWHLFDNLTKGLRYWIYARWVRSGLHSSQRRLMFKICWASRLLRGQLSFLPYCS